MTGQPPVDSRLRDIAGLLQAGRPREAEIACRALLAARPSDAIAQNLLGVALRQTNRPDESEIALRRAVELSGGNPEFRSNLAQLLRVDVDGWLTELPLIREYYDQFGDRMPKALLAELDAMRERLEAAKS